MSDEFACSNCRGQSVVFPEVVRDDAGVFCRTCGGFIGTVMQFRSLVERQAQRSGIEISHC